MFLFSRLMEDIGNEYRMSEDQWITWEAGSFCAARHPVDKRWYRAKILQIIHKSIIEVCYYVPLTKLEGTAYHLVHLAGKYNLVISFPGLASIVRFKCCYGFFDRRFS